MVTKYIQLTSAAEQYALYRTLSKASSQSQASSSAPTYASTSTLDRANGDARSTPRTIPTGDYPTTPTPPARKSSGSVPRLSNQRDLPKAESSATAAERTLKRKASKAALNGSPPPPPSSSSRPSFITPKKPRAYSGPIHDPTPVNPFAVSPVKPSLAGPSSVIASSPFIHASSPRKLREVIEANSLRKVKERETDNGFEITPRTRARKRLRGEAVADTPMKDKVPRRKRGEGRPAGTDDQQDDGDDSMMAGKEAMMLEDVLEDDEFGPSPIKPPMGRSFTALFGEADPDTRKRAGKVEKGKEKDKEKDRSRHGDSSSFFTRRVSVPKGREKIPPDVPADNLEGVAELTAIPLTKNDATIEEANAENSENLSNTPDYSDVVHENGTTSQTQRREKVVTFSDDEEDEWDPEGGHIQRKLYITGTRRPVRQHSSDETQSAATSDDGLSDDEEVPVDEDDTAPALAEGTTATSPTHPSSPSSSTLAPPMLSLLSLHSPIKRNTSRMTDLRVKAIFNPFDAARLKAIKRGQDVIGGEAINEAENDLDHVGGFGEEAKEDGDDDWDEECEGWKKSGFELDDDDEGW